MLPDYAELHCLSNFTFQRGASHPEELVARAAELGYAALAITDECSLAGVVRAHVAAKQAGLRLIVGSEFRLSDGPRLVLLAANRRGYGNLSALITRGRRAARKGSYQLCRADFADGVPDCIALLLAPDAAEAHHLAWFCEIFPRAWLALEMLRDADDDGRRARIEQLAAQYRLPVAAAGDVHMHVRDRRALQDVMTAIGLGTTVAAAGRALHPNGERHLRPRAALARIYPREALAETVGIAQQCTFSLDELRYEYPEELVPPGETPAGYLRRLTDAGMHSRWPDGTPDKVRRLVERELALIAELHYEAYFLTVYDIVRFARSRDILCQGRGSAANSAVCYCLGITAVDPARMEMLFERFISKERGEPPDIDVDFEHERREEVIQYIYQKYGRDRAALAATVITYRYRSAARDVGKALGMSPEQLDRLAKSRAWWDGSSVLPERLREAGFDPESAVLRRWCALVETLTGFPRHLSQHVGGFVIARDVLYRLVPVENAAMPERTVIQWDKDDLEALGLLKVDVLGLGMLTAIRRALALMNDFRGRAWQLADVPAEDAMTYDMIQHGDTIGVFQIESRAQMAMLPRLKPATFYDLVIEVAIVRPGPIQGNMVHPYLRRRQGLEPITYPSEHVRGVLERTLGVPIFQEQVIKLAMVAAGFSAGEADALRRAMAAWKRKGGLEPFERRLIDGMRARGYAEQFARQVFEQIKGFGEYGFPESHAASFALLAYVSAWLKCHEPAAFTCALLNSQPMGFYAPAQLVQDAQRHGVEVRAVSVRISDIDCALERCADNAPALRLGLRLVHGLSSAAAERIVQARRQRPFTSVQDLAQRALLGRKELAALAAANALADITGHRRNARWQVAGVEPALPLLPAHAVRESTVEFTRQNEGEDVIDDYASVGLTLGRHPLALLRKRLKAYRCAIDLRTLRHGSIVQIAGLVICRQRPGGGDVIFVTLEDETGVANVIVWRTLAERQRRELLQARLLAVSGELQREGEVIHVIARRLHDHSSLLGRLAVGSRDFH